MCVLINHMGDLVPAENEWVLSHGIELVLELLFERHQGLILVFILRKLKLLFLSESHMHYASENRFERFWRIKFFDKPKQQLAFPTFHIKATQAAVISPRCKNCNVPLPNSPIDSTG